MGIQPELVFGYVNENAGKLPPDLASFNAWGSRPDPNYGIVRRNPQGAWRAITPGVNPNRAGLPAGKTPTQGGSEDWGITNLVDSRIEPSLIFPDPSGVGARLLAGDPATAQQFSKGGETGGAGTFDDPAPYQGDPASAPGQPGAAPSSGGQQPTGTSIAANDSLARAVEAARRLAYDYVHLQLERDIEAHRSAAEIERLAQAAAAQAAKEVQDKAVATGRYPDGTPTLDATKTGADLTGYDPGSSLTARAAAAWNQLPAGGKTGDASAAIWQSLVPGLTPEQAAQMNEAAHQYSASTGATMPEDVARQALGQITGRAPSSFGAMTPAAQHLQNVDANAILDTLSRLRGPENAFAYAQTLQNVPESIRGAVQAALGRMPVQGQNPAQAGVLGDLGVQQPTALPGGVAGGGQTQQLMGGQPASALPPSHAQSAAPAPGMVQTGGGLRAAPGTFPGVQGVAAPAPAVHPALATLPVAQPGTALPAQAPAWAGMIAPNQLSPTDMGRTPEYMKQLLWGAYEKVGPDGKGADRKDVQDQYLRSLPVASGPRSGRMRAA